MSGTILLTKSLCSQGTYILLGETDNKQVQNINFVIGQIMISTMEKIRLCGRLWPKVAVRGQTAKLLEPTGVQA